MSIAQGDGFKTYTNQERNDYKEDLRMRRQKLEDRKQRWYKIGKGWILTEEQNRLYNPRGFWKWHGWQTEAREYWVRSFSQNLLRSRLRFTPFLLIAQYCLLFCPCMFHRFTIRRMRIAVAA